jgi:hypothetical protein
VIAGALEGEAIEDVLLVRDEMANFAWAVERVVEGADGRPRDRTVEYGTRLTAAPTPEIASPAELVYVLQTSVPEHWIPLVPVRDPAHLDVASAVVLQRGSLLTQDGTLRPITAQGTILQPDVSPWYFHEGGSTERACTSGGCRGRQVDERRALRVAVAPRVER